LKKKGKYADRREFIPLSPPPTRYPFGQGSTAVFLKISEFFRSLPIPTGVAKAVGHEPRERVSGNPLNLQADFESRSIEPVFKHFSRFPALYNPDSPVFRGGVILYSYSYIQGTKGLPVIFLMEREHYQMPRFT
jgi:hypothetical protein